jgi:hypothetical protein
MRVNLVLALRSSSSTPDRVARQSVGQLTRHVRLFGTFFRRLQQLSPRRFLQLPMCTELVLYYWDKVVHASYQPPELIAGSLRVLLCNAMTSTDDRYLDMDEAVYPVRFLVQALIIFKDNLVQWSPRRNTTPGAQSSSAHGILVTLIAELPLCTSSIERVRRGGGDAFAWAFPSTNTSRSGWLDG